MRDADPPPRKTGPPAPRHRAAATRVLLAAALVLGLGAAWQAQRPSPGAPRATPRVIASGSPGPTPTVPDAREPALPPAAPDPSGDTPATVPRPDLGATAASPQRADWSLWLDAAQQGDAVAACRLAALADECRLAGDVERMLATQESMAASGDVDPAQAAREIAALEASVDAVRARCSVLPDALRVQDWDFLQRAAVAGHEPSMLRFLVDPPMTALSPAEREAAREAYRREAPRFLDALLQRASPDALALAYRIAQGEEFVAGLPVRARDPRAALRYGTALLALREDDPATRIGVDTLLAQLDPGSARDAQTDGRRLVAPFLQRQATHRAAHAATDECMGGWPGAEFDTGTSAF